MVRAVFVFLNLLESDAETLVEVVLRHAAGQARGAHPQSDLAVVSIGMAGVAHFPDLPRSIPVRPAALTRCTRGCNYTVPTSKRHCEYIFIAIV